MAGVSAWGRIRLINSPSCGHTLPKTCVYSRTRCVGTSGRQPAGAQQRTGSLIRPKRASSSNIRRKGWSGCPAATASTLAWSFFKSGPGGGVVLGMLGAWRDLPPLVPGQQPIHRGVGHGVPHTGFVARFDPARGDEPPGLGVGLERSQHRLFFWDGQVLMVTTALGPPDGGSQTAAQIIGPDAPHVAHAEAGDPGNGCGGEVFVSAQPKALQALEGGRGG